MIFLFSFVDQLPRYWRCPHLITQDWNHYPECKFIFSVTAAVSVFWCRYDISLNHIIIVGNCPLGQKGRGGGGRVLPMMTYRRRLCSIPYRRMSYPIARCSCQNVIGGRNRQHTRWPRANNDWWVTRCNFLKYSVLQCQHGFCMLDFHQ